MRGRFGGGAIARRAKRVDGNQSEVVRRLEQIPGTGVLVINGAIDFIVARGGVNYLIELKDPTSGARRHRTPTQVALLAAWPGQYAICETFDDILRVIGVLPQLAA